MSPILAQWITIVLSFFGSIGTLVLIITAVYKFTKWWRNRKCTAVLEDIKHYYKEKFKYLSFVEGNTSELYMFDEIYVGEAGLKFVPPNNGQKSKSSGEQDTTTDKLESLLGSSGKRVIIEGAPGSGKTTLTKWICRQWEMKRSFTKYKMILRLPLKECTSEDVKSLSDAIRKCFPNQQTNWVEILLKFVTRNQNDILIILDGYDEIRNGEHTWYDELICGSKGYEGCQILITTRVGFLNYGSEMLQETQKFRLEFNPENMRKFIRNYFKENTTSQSQVGGLLDNVSLRELCTCPLVLGMICFLVKDSSEGTINALQNKYISSTTVYSHFFNKLMIKHLQVKSNKRSVHFNETEFEHEFMNKEKPNVGLVAVFLLRNGNDTFTLGDLQKEFKEQYNEYKSLCEKLEKLGILMSIGSCYKFFHLSVVEFLSAWHIVRNISEFIPDAKLTFSVSVNTMCFIVGLIASLNIELDDVKLRGIICDGIDMENLYLMVYETLSNKNLFFQCCKVIDELYQHLRKIESLANDCNSGETSREELVKIFRTIIEHDSELDRKCDEFKTLLDKPLLESLTSSISNITYGLWINLHIFYDNLNDHIFNSNARVIGFYHLWQQLLSLKTINWHLDMTYEFASENITADSFSELGNIIELSSPVTLCPHNLTSTFCRSFCTTSISLYFKKKTDQKAVTLLFGSKPSLQWLSMFILSGYELKDSEELKCLVDYLPIQELTMLRLDHCGNMMLKNTPSGGVSPFVQELKESSNIRNLSLKANNFGPDDMGSLFTALQNMPYLRRLDLGHNQLSLINDADATLFTSALNGMSKLTRLHLRNCNLTDEGIVPCLSQAILNGQLQSIREIHLENNLINKEAAVLVKAVVDLNETRHMDLLLEGNPIDKETLNEMADIVTEILSQDECSRIASSHKLTSELRTMSKLCGKSKLCNFMHYPYAPFAFSLFCGIIEPTIVTFNLWSESMQNACRRKMERQTLWISTV